MTTPIRLGKNSTVLKTSTPSRRSLLRPLFPVVAITALPLALTSNLWLEVWRGVRPRAWDGTSHYAIGQIYDRSIFPDIFGWTYAYFGGMPFPNFYPPLFHFCVSLLHHTHLLSYTAAFKIMVAAPTLLMPTAVWSLAWAISNKNRMVGHCAALASILLLIHTSFQVSAPLGLDYANTFETGLYSQPLGFVLLSTWYVLYFNVNTGRRWRFTLASLLLGLTILSNVFNTVTAAIFVAATLIHDLVGYYAAKDLLGKNEVRNEMFAHLTSALAGAGIASCWVVPMISSYEYLVTRPVIFPLSDLSRFALWMWYAIAAVGMVCWLRRPTRAMWPFLSTCVALASGVLFSPLIAPRWFPLYASRFLATLNFLLSVPVGQAISICIENFAALGMPIVTRLKPSWIKINFALIASTTFIGLVLLSVICLKPPPHMGWFTSVLVTNRDLPVFYPSGDHEKFDGVLSFAMQHHDGRYLVEVPRPASVYLGDRRDSRALNSYLGAQGNEALSVTYHEASPNSLFFLPVENGFSDSREGSMTSSILVDDIDFHNQPLAKHLERARFIGIKYLVICSPKMKARVEQEPLIGSRHDFGAWSVFEVAGGSAPEVQALSFRPALVVSSFTVKQRRRNEYSFIRLAEEQFADAWFDVLLVRSPEKKIDHLREVDEFGALILDSYECDNEDLAFERLRDFAQDGALILLSSDTALFRRIQADIAKFPHAHIIERRHGGAGELVGDNPYNYGSTAIRSEWAMIRCALDQEKQATQSTAATAIECTLERNMIEITPQDLPLPDTLPVIIRTTYHPNWTRSDGAAVYAATPFFMVTFVRGATRLVYARHWLDWIGLLVSVGTLIILICYCIAPRYRARISTPLPSEAMPRP